MGDGECRGTERTTQQQPHLKGQFPRLAVDWPCRRRAGCAAPLPHGGPWRGSCRLARGGSAPAPASPAWSSRGSLAAPSCLASTSGPSGLSWCAPPVDGVLRRLRSSVHRWALARAVLEVGRPDPVRSRAVARHLLVAYRTLRQRLHDHLPRLRSPHRSQRRPLGIRE